MQQDDEKKEKISGSKKYVRRAIENYQARKQKETVTFLS